MTIKNCKVVIYDCDGVMFDSFEANLEFYQRIMTSMNKPRLDRENTEYMRILHTYSHREVLAHFLPDNTECNQAIEHASRLDYKDLVPLMQMEEGFLDVLKVLHPTINLAVCTNRSTSMDMVLDSFGLTSYFSCVMTAAKVQNPKPHPEPLLRVLNHYGISSGEALFIGDSEVDCQAATAAGIPFVAYKAELTAMARIDHHRDIVNVLLNS